MSKKKSNGSSPATRKELELELQTGTPTETTTDVLVLGAFADGTLPPVTQAVDRASQGKLSSVILRGDLEESAGSTLLLHDVPGTAAERILLVSLGKRDAYAEASYRKALKGTSRALSRGAARKAAVTLADVELPKRDLAWRLQEAGRTLADGAYHFDAPRAKNDGNGHARGVERITLLSASRVDEPLERALARGRAIAEGMALARDLGNLPGNVCTPEYLADTARALGKELGFDVEVLEREDMARLGMGSALAVGRASAHPCKFIIMRYEGAGSEKPIVLAGKGVTFDTGGVSLKPGADMDEMKFDMCGAASVFGALRIAASLKLSINLVGIVPAVENMPGGDAARPGDVVTSMSGTTIEILDTDAEGRLILCDALTYAERFEPACVIDLATLTGACVVALGNVASGLFSNDDDLAGELLDCGAETGDRAWRLPLWEDYLVQLKSNFADLANVGGRPAGAVTAACFLGRFTEKYTWAHLDIAGTSAVSGADKGAADKGATGRPVPLLSEFLIRRSEGKGRPQPAAT